MTALVKARLAEIGSGERPTEVPETSVDVQFNPSTLRVQISNRTAGGAQAGAQARQRPGTGEMQVGFDLVFDTADEGRADAGVNVLERTAMVERFVRPRSNKPGEEAPPRVLFEWGSFQVQGTMENASIDIDLFDAAGTPLRAKVAVSIKGQDPRWAYAPATTPAAASAAAPGAGQGSALGAAPRPRAGTALPPGAPGTAGMAGAVAAIVQALPGESLVQLAARVGVSTADWRALAGGMGGAAGGGNPLQLGLGQEVAVPAARDSGLAEGQGGGGQDAGATRAALPLAATGAAVAGASAGGAAGLQRAAPAAARAAAADPVQAGQALAAQGGAGGAIAQRRAAAHQADAAGRLAAFGAGTEGATAGLDGRPWGAGVPLRPRRGAAVPAAPASTAIRPSAPAARWRSRCGCSGPARCGCGVR